MKASREGGAVGIGYHLDREQQGSTEIRSIHREAPRTIRYFLQQPIVRRHNVPQLTHQLMTNDQ